MLQAVVSLALLATRVAGHAYINTPVSKNSLSHLLRNNHGNWPAGMPEFYRYDPANSANSGECGAQPGDMDRGLDVWQKWYDAANVAVPVLTPGSDLKLGVTMAVEHGGQAWMQIACGSTINDQVNWTFLERAQSDRSVGYLPSNPKMFAWMAGGGRDTWWHVPSSFSCPSQEAVGRWLWNPTMWFPFNEFDFNEKIFDNGLGVAGRVRLRRL